MAALDKASLQDYYRSSESFKVFRSLEDNRAKHETYCRQANHPNINRRDDLIAQGAIHEAAGRIQQACAVYQRILCEYPNSQGLRAHINALITRFNESSIEISQQQRIDRWAEERLHHGAAPFKMPPPPPQPRKVVGPITPLSAEQYGAALRQQAKDARRQHLDAKNEERRLERNEMAVEEARAIFRDYNSAIKGEHQDLEHRNYLENERRARRKERAAELKKDWDERLNLAAKMQSIGGPLGGVGEYHRRQLQVDANVSPAYLHRGAANYNNSQEKRRGGERRGGKGIGRDEGEYKQIQYEKNGNIPMRPSYSSSSDIISSSAWPVWLAGPEGAGRELGGQGQKYGKERRKDIYSSEVGERQKYGRAWDPPPYAIRQHEMHSIDPTRLEQDPRRYDMYYNAGYVPRGEERGRGGGRGGVETMYIKEIMIFWKGVRTLIRREECIETKCMG